MNDITIRTLSRQELTSWLAFLCRDVFPDDPPEVVRGIWENDPAKDFGGVIVAAEPDGSIVGSFKAECCTLNLAGHSVRGGIVSGVGVKESRRGQGISRRLFDAGHRYLTEKGALVSHLYSNPDTLDFYLRLGCRTLPRKTGESFYRMYRLIRPFSVGENLIADSESLADFLKTGKA